jgi:hypothetical protein
MSEETIMPDSGLDEEADMKAEVFLPENYTPAEDEPFMNERQVEYFRRKLIMWKQELLDGSRDTIEGLQDSTRAIPDVADRARKRPTARWSCAPATASASWWPRSTRAAPDRRGRIRLLRGHRRADQPQAPRCAPHRHHEP